MQGPHAEVHDVLGVGLAAVANLEHVHVVEVAGHGARGDGGHLVEDVHHGAVEAGPSAANGFGAWAAVVRPVEAVVNVAAHAAGVCDAVGPVKRVVVAPVAHGVDHFPAGCVEGVGHDFVAVKGEFRGPRLALVEAVVVFEVVDAPFSPEIGIFLLIA